MQRILQVVFCLERGGTESFIMNQYRAIDRSEYQFDFLVFTEKEYPYTGEILNLGGRIFFCIPPTKGRIVKSVRKMIGILKCQGSFLAIHSHINFDNAWVMVAAALAGVRVRVSHSHDTEGRRPKGLRRLYHRFQRLLIRAFATAFVACGVDAGRHLYGRKLFESKGRVLRNGIDLQRFLHVSECDVSRVKKEIGLSPSCGMVVGNITRFEDKKNQMFALDVFKHILEDCPNAILILGGSDGGRLNDVKRKAEDLDIGENVFFIGERNDVNICLKLLDVYLFPSLYEGLPIALLEAQASGCFCVSSKNVSDEVDLGLGRILFCDLHDDPEMWSKSIQSALLNSEKPDEDRVRAVFLEKGYDVSCSSRSLLEVYRGA